LNLEAGGRCPGSAAPRGDFTFRLNVNVKSPKADAKDIKIPVWLF
jgi:hypothetical protein